VDLEAEARRRLEAATVAVKDAAAARDWGAARLVREEQLAAERDLARIRGEQYAEPVDLGLRWDVGAPLPHVIADSWRTLVVFHRPAQDPDWDGTYVRVVSAGQVGASALGLVEFTGAYLTSFGGLNDEALHGHPLSGRGLVAYRAHVVHNSEWIAAAERANSVHPRHRGGWHDRYRHFVLGFHDETFECIAEDWRAEPLDCSMSDAIALATARLLTR
jgi:hypothetical protein